MGKKKAEKAIEKADQWVKLYKEKLKGTLKER